MIKIKDVVTYYKAKPHEITALDQLQAELDKSDLSSDNATWVKTWRFGPKVNQPSETITGAIKALSESYIVKNIKFWPQTDNYTQPDRTCFSSTCAMAVFQSGKPISSDDEYLRKVLQIGDTTNPNVQLQVLQSYGLKVRYSQSLGFTDLDAQLGKGKCIPIGILHRGPASAPTGGH